MEDSKKYLIPMEKLVHSQHEQLKHSVAPTTPVFL